MQVIYNLAEANLQAPSLVTIGSYDGVHIGHQHLIRQMQQAAQRLGCHTALVTFHPAPKAVLAPHLNLRYLTTPEEKIALLRELGVDLTALLPFTRETARTSAFDFVKGLVAHLNMEQLWVGPDFALGRDREGDIPTLGEIGQELGYQLHVIEPLARNGEPVSSTRIRHLLTQGEIRQATELLGRYPRLTGRVTQGARRGRLLGFPTANLSISPDRVIPANGVYACFVRVNQERYQAVTNIGVRPSFEGDERTIEAHVLDFDSDLYGRELRMEFVGRLRPEKRFSDINDLVSQIRSDAERAADLLAQESP